MINTSIRLVPTSVYRSQSERTVVLYNEIYGRHRDARAALPPRLPPACNKRSERKGVEVPLLLVAIIIIEFPFDSRLLPYKPDKPDRNHRKKETLLVCTRAVCDNVDTNTRARARIILYNRNYVANLVYVSIKMQRH